MKAQHLEFLVEEPSMEAFLRALQKHGYFKGGIPKIEIARTLGAVLDPTRCSSESFAKFRDGILEAIA